jgi:hypothetical protein
MVTHVWAANTAKAAGAKGSAIQRRCSEMARTLYMNDGSMELVFGSEQDTLQKVIYEHLGRDCEELYKEIVSDLRREFPEGDDYERIADGYRSMLQDALEGFDYALKLLDKPRLDKSQLRNHLQTVRDNLYKNM